MKSIAKIFAVIFCLLLALPAAAAPTETPPVPPATVGWVVNFDAQIQIKTDSSLDITETIDYNFGTTESHGIYRDILYKYKARVGNFNLRLSDISVSDGTGRSVPVKISEVGDSKRLRIGDANTLTFGLERYVIHYVVGRALNYFTDHDELYWNVTGDQWVVPIDKVTATLILPKAVAPDTLQVACYFGAYGSTQACSDVVPFSSGAIRDRVEFAHGQTLNPGEGFSSVFGFPKGLVAKPSVITEALQTMSDNWVLFLPLLVFALMFYLWYTRGRDPKGRGVVVAEYEPPDKLTPAEIGTLVDTRADGRDVSAEIVNLAVRGYLKINRVEKKAFLGLGKTHDYELIQLKPVDNALPDFDQEILKRLFADKAVSENVTAADVLSGLGKVSLSRLKGKFAKDFQEIQRQIYQSVTLKGYFVTNPNKARAAYMGAGTAVLFIGFWLGGIFGVFGVVALAASGIIITVFGALMPKKTPAGALVKERILGLKEYLSVAEKARLEFHNSPERTPERFEKLLPYAMALGVEEKWAKQFEGIYLQQPTWYNDSSGAAFNAMVLTSAMGDFHSTAQGALTPSRSTGAAGGASGFGGGGFSGGGFGGGGGGSW